MNCKVCGNNVGDNDKTCPMCGSDLERQRAEAGERISFAANGGAQPQSDKPDIDLEKDRAINRILYDGDGVSASERLEERRKKRQAERSSSGSGIASFFNQDKKTDNTNTEVPASEPDSSMAQMDKADVGIAGGTGDISNDEKPRRIFSNEFVFGERTKTVTAPPVQEGPAAGQPPSPSYDSKETVIAEESSEESFFALKSSDEEQAKFAVDKKNEEFQELLDKEFERLKKKEELGQEIKSQIEPEPAAVGLYQREEDGRSYIDERIDEYLKRTEQDLYQRMSNKPSAGGVESVTETAIPPASPSEEKTDSFYTAPAAAYESTEASDETGFSFADLESFDKGTEAKSSFSEQKKPQSESDSETTITFFGQKASQSEPASKSEPSDETVVTFFGQETSQPKTESEEETTITFFEQKKTQPESDFAAVRVPEQNDGFSFDGKDYGHAFSHGEKAPADFDVEEKVYQNEEKPAAPGQLLRSIGETNQEFSKEAPSFTGADTTYQDFEVYGYTEDKKEPESVVPEPIIPVAPGPIEAVEPKPIEIVTPEPIVPVVPEPIVPVTPEPIVPVVPEPIVPVVPEPVTPFEEKKEIPATEQTATPPTEKAWASPFDAPDKKEESSYVTPWAAPIDAPVKAAAESAPAWVAPAEEPVQAAPAWEPPAEPPVQAAPAWEPPVESSAQAPAEPFGFVETGDTATVAEPSTQEIPEEPKAVDPVVKESAAADVMPGHSHNAAPTREEVAAFLDKPIVFPFDDAAAKKKEDPPAQAAPAGQDFDFEPIAPAVAASTPAEDLSAEKVDVFIAADTTVSAVETDTDQQEQKTEDSVSFVEIITGGISASTLIPEPKSETSVAPAAAIVEQTASAAEKSTDDVLHDDGPPSFIYGLSQPERTVAEKAPVQPEPQVNTDQTPVQPEPEPAKPEPQEESAISLDDVLAYGETSQAEKNDVENLSAAANAEQTNDSEQAVKTAEHADVTAESEKETRSSKKKKEPAHVTVLSVVITILIIILVIVVACIVTLQVLPDSTGAYYIRDFIETIQNSLGLTQGT